jgi:hypothetical protein
LEKVDRGEYKGSLSYVTISTERSGAWAVDGEHPYFLKDGSKSPSNIKLVVWCTTWKNRSATGMKDGVSWATSLLVFITKDWILTKSGSVYRVLNYKVSYKKISYHCRMTP